MIFFTFIGYLCCLMCAWQLGYYGGMFLDVHRRVAPIGRAVKELDAMLQHLATLNTKEVPHG